MLTKKQVKEYVANGGIICPYCGEKEVEGNNPDVDGPTGNAEAWCGKCGEEWEDIYQLVGIKEN